MRLQLIALLNKILCLFLFASGNAFSHGGVVLEEDICLIKVGFFQAHFTVFQPRTREHEQFCEDLPDTGESLFVLEYLHDGLEKMSVDFRIIENLTGNGSFANQADIELIEDIDAITVFYQPPLQNPDVFAVLHNFEEEGEFIGVVTAQNPKDSKRYTAVFPFEAGFTSNDISNIAVLLTVLSVSLGWIGFLLIKRKRTSPILSLIALVALISIGATPKPAYAEFSNPEVIVAVSESYKVAGKASINPVAINQIHSWTLNLQTHDSRPVEKADITVSGGMPLHDHGLPTQPKVVSEILPGKYQVDGLKFHMRGYWEITIEVRKEDTSETLVLGLNL